ncbi:MAG: hypothetical protein N2Z20_02860 [Elusimicrobiales bacterium]|nr:hypothetical protein [Elusimicrobiales bacterium]
MRKNKIYLILLIILVGFNIRASLYYDDYLDNAKYRAHFGANNNLILFAIDIATVKIANSESWIPTILVIDEGFNRIAWNHIYYEGVNTLYEIKKYGKYGYRAPDTVRFPQSIAAFSVNENNKGDIFISETGNNRIVKLQFEKTTLTYIKQKLGEDENDAVQTTYPGQISIDRFENIYVVFSENKFIRKFDKNLNPIRLIGQGILNNTKGCAISNYKEWLLVSEQKDNYSEIIQFDLNGNKGINLRSIDILYLPSNAQFGYMDCDVFGNLYVVDPVNNKIYKFNPGLEYLDTCSGGYQKPFTNLRSVAVDKIYNYQGKPGSVASYGMVFTLEKQRVQYFDIGMDIVRVNPIKDFFLPQKGEEAEIEEDRNK